MSGIKGSKTTIGDRGSKCKWQRDGEKRSWMWEGGGRNGFPQSNGEGEEVVRDMMQGIGSFKR